MARTYAFAPFGGVGYSVGIFFEFQPVPREGGVGGESQWIDIAIFDTVAGTTWAVPSSAGRRRLRPGRSLLYRGDNNSSGIEIHKFDVIGTLLPNWPIFALPAFCYGSRTVVVSEDPSRVTGMDPF
jgi:hypothetical protein